MKQNIFFILFALFSFNLTAQSLEETLSNLSSSGASAYIAPISGAFGANLNSGWFNGAPPASKLSVNVELKIVASGTFFSDENKSFSTAGTYRYTSSQIDQILQNASSLPPGSAIYNQVKAEMLLKDFSVQFSGPTIVGSKNDFMEVKFPGETIQGQSIGEYSVKLNGVAGFLNDLSLLPQPGVQLNLGTVYGTDVSFRYFPSIEISDLGKFSMFGFGIMHNPGVWLKNPLPLDVAFGFFHQSLEVGSLFEASATQFGIIASKTFGAGISITPYAGLTFESSTTKVTYDRIFTTPAGSVNIPISFENDGENSAAFTLGAAFDLFIMKLNLDYKLASVNTASIGLSFGY